MTHTVEHLRARSTLTDSVHWYVLREFTLIYNWLMIERGPETRIELVFVEL